MKQPCHDRNEPRGARGDFLRRLLGAAATLIAAASCAQVPARPNTATAFEPAPFGPRPVYAVAHRANSGDAVIKALALGANALELDIRVHRGRFCANHDPITGLAPCEPLAELLDIIRQAHDDATRRGNAKLGLVVYDFKDDGRTPEAGGKLLDLIRQHLTDGTGINTLISIARRADHRYLDGAYHRLRSGEALAVDFEDDPDTVSAFFESRGVRSFAFGAGCCVVCLCPGTQEAITRAIALRAKVRRLDFVYVWTLAKKASLGEYLRLGVDGIFVNGGWVVGTSNDIPLLLREIDETPGVVLAPASHHPFP